MLESEQTLIPAFPRGPDGRRVRPRADRRRADGTDDSPRREHRGRPGAKAYAVAAACHASSRRKPCISHSGTFAIPYRGRGLGASFRESHVRGERRPREPLRRECHPRVLSFGKQNNSRRGFAGSRGRELGRHGCFPPDLSPGPRPRTPESANPRPHELVFQKTSACFRSPKVEDRRQRGCNCRPTPTVLFRRAPGALPGEERDWRPTCISSPVLRH